MNAIVHKACAALVLAAALGAQVAVAEPQVKISTNMGDIVVELNSQAAPKSVANFMNYVRSDAYSGTIFHRVIGDFMIQGGGFTQEYKRKPVQKPVMNEADNELSNARGTIAMARTGDPHSATNQFFINVKDNKMLDHTGKDQRGWGYTVFGNVTDGMDVVDKIRQVETGAGGPFRSDAPKSFVVINSITEIPVSQ